MKARSFGLCLSLGLALACAPSTASAQSWLMDGQVDLQSGVAGGGSAGRLVRRARTTLRLGLTLRNDEVPKDAFQAGLVLEIEPRSALGLEGHWVRCVSDRVRLGLGGVGFLAPKTLVGASAFGTWKIPLGAGFGLVTGPALQVFFAGRDLPTASPIWQLGWRLGIDVAL
jgi:hypothetical protein